MFIDVLCRAVSRTFRTATVCVLVAFTCDTGDAAHARSRTAQWCAWDSGIDEFNCSFYTHRQCMENAWGNGGLCVPSPRGSRRLLPGRRFCHSMREGERIDRYPGYVELMSGPLLPSGLARSK